MRGAPLLLAASLVATGCGPSPEAEERVRILHAVDVLRDAPAEAGEQRRPLLEAVERVPLKTPDAIRARDACASAYRLLLDGNLLEKKVKAALDGDKPPDLTVVQQLLDAEEKIKKSKVLMQDCDQALGDLRSPGHR